MPSKPDADASPDPTPPPDDHPTADTPATGDPDHQADTPTTGDNPPHHPAQDDPTTTARHTHRWKTLALAPRGTFHNERCAECGAQRRVG